MPNFTPAEWVVHYRFIATPHWQHGDWTVYDEQRDVYRLRGLTEIEALEQAEALNQQEASV